MGDLKFNPPPNWPKPPDDWVPPKGWSPDPSWPPVPEGWLLWIDSSESQVGMEASNAFLESQPSEPNVTASEDAMSEVDKLREEIRALRHQLDLLEKRSSKDDDFNDEEVIRSVGIYRYHHPLENAQSYKSELKLIDHQLVCMVKEKRAIEASELFTYNNSLAQGKKMTTDLSSLMLRAYNSEVENCIRTLRAGNLVVAKKRLERSRNTIAKLGKMMEMKICDEFHNLRWREIELTADYLMKKQEEREAAREERARLREEKKVAMELAAERENLEKELKHIENTLLILNEKGKDDPDLRQRQEELQMAVKQNDFRAANIRAGYVYIISNRGSFGEGVVKIGLTRRLEPIHRIQELSGASVPFRFDVHVLFFSEDAVSLERELHSHFADRRLNHANSRKEFFFASPLEVKAVLERKVGNLLEYQEKMEGVEFVQSLKYWPKDALRS